MAKYLSRLALVLALVVSPGVAQAAPPFVYSSALKWLRATVHSDVPPGDRIYVLGPDKIEEGYRLNGALAMHDMESSIVVSAKAYGRLADLVADLPYKDRAVTVLVWRAARHEGDPDRPAFSGSIAKALLASFPLRPGDIVELKPLGPAGTMTAALEAGRFRRRA